MNTSWDERNSGLYRRSGISPCPEDFILKNESILANTRDVPVPASNIPERSKRGFVIAKIQLFTICEKINKYFFR